MNRNDIVVQISLLVKRRVGILLFASSLCLNYPWVKSLTTTLDQIVSFNWSNEAVSYHGRRCTALSM